MPSIRIPKGWEIPGSKATPESVYVGRRRFMTTAGLAGLGAVAAAVLGTSGCADGGPEGGADARAPGSVGFRHPESWNDLYPARRNEAFALDRPVTDEKAAGRYNNFYEFTTDKLVEPLARKFPYHPWSVEVAGLVRRPRRFDIDELLASMPLEERLYRHRCVEAWSMAVPWTGFTFRALLHKVEPLSTARFVRLVSFDRPELAPGQAMQSWYPWPYYEALSMAEAANELTLLATGIYGHPLPMQHGAPIRLVTPWKYGFKSIKSITRIEFLDRQPPAFWNDVAPAEYDLVANVDPAVPHPRWSQATERFILAGGASERIPTRRYNGYEDFVAHLYD
ncbi:MAG TPA: protein-methionine-sulfoxide reductase catalytic subunit MsrP [Candidatus Polarisedimenticolia bacterium]|nr:protein-methionine-sulfoxide reductase catalytic subunit MsrP [Candidatus Polarisedimenticolia bacterium]